MFHFEDYVDHRGVNVIEEELSALPDNLLGTLLRKLDAISEHGFTRKSYTLFKGYPANIQMGEFILGDYRVLNCRLNETTFLLLHVFKKRTNETPPKEKAIAWNRLMDYLSNQKPL